MIIISDLGGVFVHVTLQPITKLFRDAYGDRYAMDFPFSKVAEAVREFEVGKCGIVNVACAASDHGARIMTADLIAAWCAKIPHVHKDVVRLYTVQRALGTRVVAMSNTNDIHMNHMWREFRPEMSTFDAVYTSCEMGVAKPDREAFQMVFDSEREHDHD
ncbi:unnamed protein product, partial [marine sediment metagenome]